MKTKAICSILGLFVLGGFIWLRGTLGLENTSDTLPLLAAFPLYVWLILPCRWITQPRAHSRVSLFAGLGLCVAGMAADSTLVLAFAWVALLDAFQQSFLEKVPRRFLVMPIFGFPWVTQNLESLGWLFRLTGAAAVQGLFTILGMTVHREGTMLYIQDLPLSVEPACAGLNVLQAMLIVGCLLICMQMPSGRRFWIALAALAPLAWVANTARIFMLGCAGLMFGSDFARGWFHNWGGWLVLCLMFLLCERVFSLLAVKRSATA